MDECRFMSYFLAVSPNVCFLMDRLLNLAKAARLVGVNRGALQKKIHDGALESFEGMVRLDDLAALFPEKDLTPPAENLDRYEQIIEEARLRARNRKLETLFLPDMETLAARTHALNRELAQSRQQITRFKSLFDSLLQALRDDKNSAWDGATRRYISQWIEQQLTVPMQASTDNVDHLLRQDTFMRLMTAHVRLRPSNSDYFVEGNDNLLESALRVGLPLNYGCSGGNCGKCKAKLISGEIRQTRPHDFHFTEAEKLQGWFLMCSNTAVSDLVLEANVAGDSSEIPEQEITCKVRKVEHPIDDMLVVHARTPRTQRLRFMAGQYVRMSLDKDLSDDVYIASCPCDELNLQFHICTDSDTAFNRAAREKLIAGAAFTITGPYGDFIIQEESTRPILFIAYGTGFAPIKGLVENAIALEKAESLHLYLGSTRAQHYMHNQARAWLDALDEFHYYPVLLQDDLTGHWQDIQSRHGDLSRYLVYLAGPSHWLEQTAKFLKTVNVDEVNLRIERVDHP